jgi:putative transposase
MCRVLSVRRSSFYYWLNKGTSNRAAANQLLTGEISRIHTLSKQTYGSPRVTNALRMNGFNASRPRVARLMRSAGIRSVLRKRYVATTDSEHTYTVAENHLDRNFQPGEIGKVWVSDITYIRTLAGWAYLTTVIDLGDRNVIGWHVSTTLTASETSVTAWRKAIRNRPITRPLIFHSDRGVQYACTEFTTLIASNKLVTQSMSRKGNCWDNAVAESFFKTLKNEWANRFSYKNQQQAELSVFDYIESYYNTKRQHSTLNYMTPVQYLKYLTENKSAA